MQGGKSRDKQKGVCDPQGQVHTHQKRKSRTRGAEVRVGRVREAEKRPAARRQEEHVERSGAREMCEKETTAWKATQKHREKRA